MYHVVWIFLAGLLIAGFGAQSRAQIAAIPEAGRSSLVDNRQAPARLTVAAIGDSLGDGLWEGLYRRLHDDKRFVVFRGAKNSVGFTGSDMTEQIDAAFAAGPVDALVIMIGANDDRRSFFINGKAVALFGTKPWIELYQGRIEKFMDHAGRREVPLVWVLLPVMPIWSITADDKGAYMPYFNDLKGKKRLMRHADGMHFTEPGNELLGYITFNKLLEISPLFRATTPQAAGSPGR
jgi:hypothetical protein